MNFRLKPALLSLLLYLVPPVPAPVPRCSPFIIINKLVEWTSLWSDSNAQFPVGPCEYGGPFGALAAGDTKAVFLLEEPEKIPRHNIYELVWFLKTGGTRMARMMLGLEPFVADVNILLEGYQHSTRTPRTTQLGHGTQRRPELIDDKNLWNRFVGGKFLSFLVDGPDLRQTKYTPVGPLRRHGARQPPSRRLSASRHRLESHRQDIGGRADNNWSRRAPGNLNIDSAGWKPLASNGQ